MFHKLRRKLTIGGHNFIFMYYNIFVHFSMKLHNKSINIYWMSYCPKWRETRHSFICHEFRQKCCAGYGLGGYLRERRPASLKSWKYQMFKNSKQILQLHDLFSIGLWFCNIAMYRSRVCDSSTVTVVCILVRRKSFPRFWRNHPL